MKRRSHKLWLRITTPGRARLVVVSGESPPQRQVDAEQRQHGRCDHARRNTLGVAEAGQRHLQAAKGADLREGRAPVAPVDVVLPRHRNRIGKLRRDLVEDDDARGLARTAAARAGRRGRRYRPPCWRRFRAPASGWRPSVKPGRASSRAKRGANVLHHSIIVRDRNTVAVGRSRRGRGRNVG